MVRAPVFAARMRHDRERLADAQAEILALRGEVERLRGTAPYRAYEKARRAYHAMPGALQGVVRTWRALSSAQPSAALEHGAPEHGATSPGTRGRALVIDDHWPQPDRDAGSVEIVNLLQSLARLGFDVVFAAARDHETAFAARDALVHSGIRCLTPEDAPSVEAFLARQGPTLDLCVLCRVYCGGRFLEQVLRDARKARIVFDTLDLNYLREERKARLAQDEAALAVARQVQEREEAIIRASDATLVVSKAELDILAAGLPEALAVEMPLARRVVPPATPFGARRGIGFIGGFAHAPNADAVRYFLAEIWPLVLRDLPGIELTIVGADFPDELLHGVAGSVRALGQVKDIGPWFEGLRLTVAPLRFGAGAKGKVASSLAAGVPCIVTPIAAEGMSLSEEAGVLVAADPAAFAARLREAYTDEALWHRLSAGGLAHAGTHLSLEGWQRRLDGLLRKIGL